MSQLFLNYADFSPEDFIGILNLSNRSFNALTREGIQTVGEVIKRVESGDLRTIYGLGKKSVSEIEDKVTQIKLNGSGVENLAKIDAISNLNDIYLSREDAIEKLNLTPRSFNALTREGIQTVGEVIQQVESGGLRPIRGLGKKSISEIEDRIAQIKFNDSKTERLAKTNAILALKQRFLSLKRVVELGSLRTVRRRGRECILEIESELAQMEMHDASDIDAIPEQVIRSQLQLVSKQISIGLLHERARIVDRSIKDWIGVIESIESRQVYEVLTSILGSSLNICEEIEFFINQIQGRNRRMIVLLSMYFESKTLEETGQEIGVSRERVRQICNEFKDKVISIVDLKSKPALLRMQSALLIAEDLGLDITYEGWTQRIRSSGLVGDWTSQDFVDTDAVEVMIAICNLLADCNIRWLQMPENLQDAVRLATSGTPNVPAKILHVCDTLSDKVKRLINRHTKFSGGVYARWLSQEMEMELEEVTDILHGLEYRPLSEGWFAPNPSQISYREVFHRCLHKMFQYCGRLAIDDICAGIRCRVSRSGFSEPEYLASRVLSRSVFPVPSPNVMDGILLIDDYQCDDELYYWDGASDENLSKGETIIMNCLEQIGPVVHHSELVQAFVESDLSVPALEPPLSYSPLFDKIEFGLYKLRGREVTYQDIERAQAAGERQSLNLEVEYDTSGNVTVSLTISPISVGLGTVFCERFPNLSGDDWKCYVHGEEAGELNATENEFRRLKKSFELLNCQPGDRLKFIFNTWERTVTIERVEVDAQE